jgi:hypothetical protein
VYHLLAHPGSLSVMPMFFQGGKLPQSTRRDDRRNGRDRPTENKEPPTSVRYREGEVWATK